MGRAAHRQAAYGGLDRFRTFRNDRGQRPVCANSGHPGIRWRNRLVLGSPGVICGQQGGTNQ